MAQKCDFARPDPILYAVTLNPERDSVIAEHVKEKLIQPLAA